MKPLSRNAIIGYPAGIITGITYGLNPLFAMPLMRAGASIESILFFRYIIAVAMLAAFLVLRRESFRISPKQAAVLLTLGVLFSTSSISLFSAYQYIPSGLATTLVFLFPVLVALIMVFLKVVPSWPVWLSIVASFIGVVIMSQGDSAQEINPPGIWLSLGSALAYALFVVIINRSRSIAAISNSLLTLYALSVGAVIFFVKMMFAEADITAGLEVPSAWFNLVMLAILPTIVSTATLAVATRNIGATKASVLCVFEPVTAVLVGSMVFGEALTTNIIVGILLSMAAVTFMILYTKR